MSKLENKISSLILSENPNLEIIWHPEIEELNDWPWKKERSKRKLKCDFFLNGIYVEMTIFAISKMRFLCDHLKNYYVLQATEPDWSADVETQIKEISNSSISQISVSNLSRFRLEQYVNKKKEEYLLFNSSNF